MAGFYVRTSLGFVHGRREGAGPSLLLLGSAGRSSRQFRDLAAELAPVFDVVAPDLPGFGGSDPLPPGTTVQRLADMLVELMDGLEIVAMAIFGLHTGNKIGTALAVRHPRRVTRLVLAGQSHSLVPDRETRNAGIRHIIEAYVNTGGDGRTSATQRAEAARTVLGQGAGTDIHPLVGGALVDHAMDELEAVGTPTLYLANFGYDLEAGFRAVRVPTLVIEIATEAETRHVGLQGEAVAGLIPGACLAVLDVPDLAVPVTLEDRAGEVAGLIGAFLRS